jgi:hypothetical protein
VAKFIKFQTVTDDGHSSSECSISAEDVIFLTPASPTATFITFRGGDRKLVLGSMERVACAIEEATRTTREAELSQNKASPEPIESRMKADTEPKHPMPEVIIEGIEDSTSLEIHRKRAQALANFLGMNIVLTDKGNREEIVLISGRKEFKIEALGNRYDGGYFGIEHEEVEK